MLERKTRYQCSCGAEHELSLRTEDIDGATHLLALLIIEQVPTTKEVMRVELYGEAIISLAEGGETDAD